VIATKEDIAACFRLLLDRKPNPEEIAGHFSMVGASLDHVVASYVNSLEFQSRGLLRRETSATIVEFEGFRLYVDPEDRAIGGPLFYHILPETTDCFRDQVRPGGVVLDIGANCGYFSFLACSLGASVWAFEPLATNVRLLAASHILNRDAPLRIIPAAASSESGLLVIGASYSDGVVGPVPEGLERALNADYVAKVRIDDLIPSHTEVDLIKIDVEGHEFRALLGAADTIEAWHPVILTEFSPTALAANSKVSGREYLELLESWDYETSVFDNPRADTPDKILRACDGVDHVDLIARVGVRATDTNSRKPNRSKE
jgi:FkbM family methyltransferase